MKPMNVRPFIGAIYLLQVKRPKAGEGRRREMFLRASPVQLLLPWLKFRTSPGNFTYPIHLDAKVVPESLVL